MAKKKTKGLYLKDEADKEIEFIKSGCTLLDSVLGGGYALGRVVNIVGDKSTGKTLLAIEAAANFANTYKDGVIWYHEAEAAFDVPYASSLGLPVKSVTFKDERTVEDFYENLKKMCAELKESNTTGLYILDSLDALSDEAELSRDLTDGSFGASKAKKLSEIFRRVIQELSNTRICLIVISQIRAKLNVTFGKKQSRSGGYALDFYASQVMWLKENKKITKTSRKVTRPIGISVTAKMEKNKVGTPYRSCDFILLFGYGVDDAITCSDYLKSLDLLGRADLHELSPISLRNFLNKIRDDGNIEEIERIAKVTKEVYTEIESNFLPVSKKYKDV